MSSLFVDQGTTVSGQKVALCTTAYDRPSPGYVFSIQKSRQALADANIGSAYFLLSGNCHVDDARNSVVQEFLASDCTDLIFLDADVSWEPEELVKLCRYDVDIVGGIYPFRSATEESKQNMPVVTYPGQVEPDANGLLEVAGLPTGFMRIRRHVLETLAAKANKFLQRGKTTETPILFERTFQHGVRLGGDLSFCKKWVDAGGKVYAAVDIHLGHTGTHTAWDSLSAALRRQSGETLKYLVEQVRRGTCSPVVFSEARRALGNKWGALEDVLALCSVLGRKATGPIIEAGSGLTSIVLAAATTHQVYCLEHDPSWKLETEKLAKSAGVNNLNVILSPISQGWYTIPAELPQDFALGLNDGPPRSFGSRMGFFKHFGHLPTIICDDADDKGYAEALKAFCSKGNRRIDFIERAALIR